MKLFWSKSCWRGQSGICCPWSEVEGDLYVLLDSLNLKESDARWVASLPASLVAPWADMFRPSTFSILASCKMLALRAANVALSRDLIAFADDEDITKSPFFHLPSIVEHVVRHPEDFHRWEEQRDACEAQMQTVNQQLADRGASANLIFRVRLLRSLLGRIQQVITLERPDSDARKLAVTVVHGFASQRRIRGVVSATTRRLARSVVERTGRAGKHYIAKDIGQWGVMGMGAVVAGVITSFTALFKYSLASMIHAPLLLAIAHSLNYAVSFLLMQAGGFLLASKMPAVTAATLVDAMEDPAKDHMASLQAISKTQFIVTISNLIGAVPASIAIDRIIDAVRGHPFLAATCGGTWHSHALSAHLHDHPLRNRDRGFSLALFSGNRLDCELSRTPPYGHGNLQQPPHSREARTTAGGQARELGTASRSRVRRIHCPGIFAGRRPHYFRTLRNPSRSTPRDAGRRKPGLCVGRFPALRPTALAGDAAGLLGNCAGWCVEYRDSFVLSFLLAVRARNIGEAESRRFLREVGREFLAHPFSFLLPGETARLK